MLITCGIFRVSEMRFELTQPNGHYPLKVACLPIPPPGHLLLLTDIELLVII